MTLDILDGSEFEEENLSMAALSFARTAQERKNNLTKKLKEDKESAYYKLLKNGALRSSLTESVYAELQRVYDAAVQMLKDDLSFRIGFLGGGANEGGDAVEYSYPYNPDYSLDNAGRYYAVYNYYMAMTDPDVRFALFQADTLAASYVGRFYETLYARLRSYAEYS